MGGTVLEKVDCRWYDLHMVNKSEVAKSNEDLYLKSLEATTNKFISPWVIVISLLRSGRLMSTCIADQSSLTTMMILLYSEDLT